MRKLLNSVIQHQAPSSLANTAVRLLLRIGLTYGSGQDLILAADAASKLKVDLRADLDFLCQQGEKLLDPPSSSGGGGNDLWEGINNEELQSRVGYFGMDDRTHLGD